MGRSISPRGIGAARELWWRMHPTRPFLVAMLALLVALMPAEAAQKKKKKQPATAPAAAQPAAPKAGAAQPLGQSGSWAAFEARDGTGLVCYVMAQPQKSEPAGLSRKPMAMVTHRAGEKIANVVSFVEGYPIKPGSEVQIDIGGSKFDLFTKDDSAWARTAELDRMIVASLGKAKQVVVRGTPQKGSPTTDTYVLAGFAKALALIDKACGVKR
jgi:invasion protein IalB